MALLTPPPLGGAPLSPVGGQAPLMLTQRGPKLPLGGLDSDEHRRLVGWFTQVNRALEESCTGLYREMVAHAGLYLGQINDPRKKHEMWRSNLHLPYGASSIDTGVAAELDILLSGNPWVQAEGVGEEDQQNARAVERLIQNALVSNEWPVTARLGLQNKRIYGTQIWKITNRPRYTRLFLDVKPGELDDWQRRVQDASQRSKIPAPDPDDPNEEFPGQNRMLFNAWRDLIQRGGLGQIPDKPSSGWKNVMSKIAPSIDNQDVFSIRCDPRIYDVQDQPIIMQRTVKTARWVIDRCTDDGIFSRAMVEKALSGSPSDISTWDEQISSMLGIRGWRSTLWNNLNEDDRPVELLEIWRRHDSVPYCVLMNRTSIINNKPEELPYKHGHYPYVALRNNPQSGMFFGLSDLKQTAPMHRHMDKMWNLHMDKMVLDVIPIWLATKSAGLPADVGSLFSPGKVWSVNRLESIRTLVKDPPNSDMWRLIADLKANIDETQSTTEPVRGGAVTLNRVSATQSERAFSQSLLRVKTAALTTEWQLRPLIKQVLFLIRDYVSADDRVNTAGRDLGLDALKNVPREKLLVALDQDYVFHGATDAINRGERMAFFKDFFTTVWPAQLVAPQEARALLAMWWRESGIPGVGSVITEHGNTAVINQIAMEKQRQQAEAAAGIGVPGPPQADPGGHDPENPGIVPGTAGDMAQSGSTTQSFQ